MSCNPECCEIEMGACLMAAGHKKEFVLCAVCHTRCHLRLLLPPEEIPYLYIVKYEKKYNFPFTDTEFVLTIPKGSNYDDIWTVTYNYFLEKKDLIPEEYYKDSFMKFIKRTVDFIRHDIFR